MNTLGFRSSVVICAAFFSINASAGFLTGNELLSRLKDYRSGAITSMVTAAGGAGFVIGVADARDGIIDSGTELRFCIPVGATQGQLIDVVIRYLDRNPELRHYPAHALTTAAYSLSFTCSK